MRTMTIAGAGYVKWVDHKSKMVDLYDDDEELFRLVAKKQFYLKWCYDVWLIARENELKRREEFARYKTALRVNEINKRLAT